MDDGVMVSDLVLDQPISLSATLRQKIVEVEAIGDTAEVQVLSVPMNAAYWFELRIREPSFFAAPPMLTQSGMLTLKATSRGSCRIDIIAFDLADVDPKSATVKQVETFTIEVVVASKGMRLRRPVRCQIQKEMTHQSSPAEPPAPSPKQLNQQLQLPSIRDFRQQPPRPRLKSFGYAVSAMLPSLLLRQWNAFAEYHQLTNVRGSASHALTLLEKLHTMMQSNEVIEAVVPVIDAACRLHTKLGGLSNIDVAVRLAHLRVTVVSSALGIDVNAASPIDAAAAQRLANSHRDTTGLFVRVLVESAHLLKMLGLLHDALKYYKTAAAVSATQQGKKDTASQIPFLFASAEVYALQGDLRSAAKLFEEARAHAEIASKGSGVVAECEEQLAFIFACLGEQNDSAVALKRAQTIRREQKEKLGSAETAIFEASCHIVNDRMEQALVSLETASQGTSIDDGKSGFLRSVAEILRGFVSIFYGADVQWNPQVCLDSPSTPLRAFAAWLLHVSNEQHVDQLDAACHKLLFECGSGNPLSVLLTLSAAVDHMSTDSAAAAADASGVLTLLTTQCATTHPLLILAFEVAVVTQTLSNNPQSAETARQLAWLFEQNGTDARRLPIESRYRLSSCWAEASVASGATLTGESVNNCFTIILQFLGDLHGHFSSKLVPVLLDAAEVRYVRKEYPMALELFGKALRIIDVKNLLYLIGPLFLPRWLLKPTEVRDRDRLAAERSPGKDGFSALAMLLHQIGLTHESSGSPSKAIMSYQHALACLEMSNLESHPGCLAVLTSLGRCHLCLGETADARYYLEHGQEVFLDHFYRFGAYQSDKQLCALKRRLDATLISVRVAESHSGILLVKANIANPEIALAEIYM